MNPKDLPKLTQEDEFKARLVDEIVNDGETVKCHVLYRTHSFCLADILKKIVTTHVGVDCESAIARLLCSNRDEQIDLLDDYRKHAITLVESWLETDFYGRAVLREAIEEHDREMAEEARDIW